MLRTLMQLRSGSEALRRRQEVPQARSSRGAKGSFFVRAELGRELMLRGEYERAAAEYEDVVKAAAGDNRVLAPALRDLGQALAKLGKRKEALDDAAQARLAHRRLAGRACAREIYEIIVEVYRAEDRLRELITELEGQHAHDFEQLRMLGGLYEETGQVDKALETYKKALAQEARTTSARGSRWSSSCRSRASSTRRSRSTRR